jgi:hypothetical protein
MDAIVLRSVERIRATACGSLSPYLGYRLFQGALRDEAEARPILPSGRKLPLISTRSDGDELRGAVVQALAPDELRRGEAARFRTKLLRER